MNVRAIAISGAILILGSIGVGLAASHSAIAAIDPPAVSSFSPALIARGEILAAAGNCGACHSVPGGESYGGGYAMTTSFGTIYSTNITPDARTGIGAWPLAAFRRAMREGVARDGSHLYPVFPFDHFTKLADADIEALYAYFMTRPAAHSPARENHLPFPLNIRALQAGWKLLFFRSGRFTADAARDAQWNRGAYLAQGIAHCGACHTPRNFFGAEQANNPYAGAPIDHWIAPPLTAANPAPAPWDRSEMFAYLRSGVSTLHGTAAGPMAGVVHSGLAALPDADIDALAEYFQNSAGGAPAAPVKVGASATGAAAAQNAAADPAERLYSAACASCHYNGSRPPNPLRPDLAHNSAIHLDDPTNLLQVMLGGIDAADGAPGVVMPAFAGFQDEQILQIARYLRATRTDKAPWQNLDTALASVRAQHRQE